MKIALGSAQFGYKYGVLRTSEGPDESEVSAILDFAAKNNITVIDTAANYGRSEEVIGRNIVNSNWRVFTKTGKIEPELDVKQNIEEIRRGFSSSLRKLRLSKVEGLLVHRADDILNPAGQEIFAALNSLKSCGMVNKIGVSVYTQEQIDFILDNYTIDIIQLPFSILDQRLLYSGHLSRLKEYGIEIHARSVFLQGIAIAPPEIVPCYFNPIKKNLTLLKEIASIKHLTPLGLSLRFVLGVPEIDQIIVGVESRVQLKEILRFYDVEIDPFELKDVAVDCPKYLNPSLWPAITPQS